MAGIEEQVARAVAGDKDSLEAVLLYLKDDIYRLSLRMLGLPSDAQDASQEILAKIVTHLGTFRGEGSLRTWAWAIATRHLLRFRRRLRRQRPTDFHELETMINSGEGRAPPPFSDRELHQLAEEVRLGCTQAMLSALKPAQRVVYILSDIFGLESADGAAVLRIDAGAFRKRLERARASLGGFMERQCGLANPVVACSCVRQIPVLTERRILDPDKLVLSSVPRAKHSLPVIEAWREMTQIDRTARVFQERATETAPASLVTEIRALIESRRFRLLESMAQ